jgi:hypothetical protein
MRERLTNTTLGLTVKTAASKSTDAKRELDGVAPYDKENLAHLVSLLTHVNAAFVGVKGAMDTLSTIPLETISPDGKLGGRGYVTPVRDIKEHLSKMIVDLSNMKDTLADEFSNPGWGLSDEEKEELRSVQNKAGEGTQENLDQLDQELQGMVGDEGVPAEEGDPLTGEATPSEGDVPPVDDASSPEEDAFPSMDGIGEEPPVTPKTASSSNNVFVGLKKQASPVAKALAGRVLGELVKRASENKPKTLVGEKV